MPRYCFHLPSKDQSVLDKQGVDMPDPATAQGAADKAASELRSGLLHEGRSGCCWTVSVADEGGQVIHVTALWHG
jgi:hypothetical protein